MAQRKLQQEIDKCFKKVQEGVEEFEGIYEKYEQSQNASQREKLVENLKRECKKLQRLRDQIKSWATSNEVKDKGPLLDKRELIETQMEKFKAVEKEMKTKAFSKIGLEASAKLDPKEKEKLETTTFLSDMVEELGRQIEAMEAESESLQASTKKGKKNEKSDRIAELDGILERHKWHQGKLELLLRVVENDTVEVEQVREQEEAIRYYVENNQDVDYQEDDTIYDEFNLDEEEGRFGVHHDLDKVSSHDNQSVADDTPESESKPAPPIVSKAKSAVPPEVTTTARRPSQHIKSPLPALATLHTMPPAPSNGVANLNMRPAPPPTKPIGEPLKYASAAAAAAAADRAGVGVAPLPPPPGSQIPALNHFPLQSSATSSPSVTHSIPAQPPSTKPTEVSAESASPALSKAASFTASPSVAYSQTASATTRSVRRDSEIREDMRKATPDTDAQSIPPAPTNGSGHHDMEDDEAILHYLPASLHDLVDSYLSVKNSAPPVTDAEHQRLLSLSHANRPTAAEVEKPRYYKPKNGPYLSPSHYPQQALPIFDDPRLYDRVDADVLFYSFYYRQGTYQQYLAAKRLKGQSWRFHKQYQTWFQRHDEPKNITEDFEQGTYRFFDYESTWMNRRKADFKFAYKFLEDDL